VSDESVNHPKGFRARRGVNWGFLGLLYTSFYMCRYNLSVANKAISQEYGFSHAQMGDIITTALLAYAFGQIINGLITDRIGGKKAMLIGAAGTVVMNILFGVASFAGMLGLFVAIRGVDGYLQAFGAPGMVKINAAWFGRRERGRFSGIFGFMINLGRIGIFTLGPALLAGFTFFGMMQIPPMHWRWLFWAPSIICLVMAVAMVLTVKETPEEAGWVGVIADDSARGAEGVRAEFGQVFRAIVSNPVVWVTAFAYACTGAVRQSVDQWFPQLFYRGSSDSDCGVPGFFAIGLCFRYNFQWASRAGGGHVVFSGDGHHFAGGAVSWRRVGHSVSGPDCVHGEFHPFHSGQRRADGHWRKAVCRVCPWVD
jgi:OPA family glycerol-3-phosphate transporter-like MFS transporter